MLAPMLLMAAAPSVTQPSGQQLPICKVVVDHPLKSRRIIACGTAERWQDYNLALHQAKRKAERNAIQHSQAYAGVGQGY
jgi:hypothetical protein